MLEYLRKIDLHLVGISLVIVGVPYGMYLNQLYPMIKWSPIVMLLSLILIMPWKNLFVLKFPSSSKFFLWLLLFQAYMLFRGWNSPKMTDQYMFYHIYIIILIIAFSGYRKRYSLSNLPSYLAIISFPLLVLGVFYCRIGLVATNEAWELGHFTTTYFLDPFTIAYGAYICFFSTLCCNLKKKPMRFLCAFSFILCVYTILYCQKRSPFLVLVGGVLYYLYIKELLNFKYIKKQSLLFLTIIFVIIISANIIPNFHIKTENLFNNTLGGISDILYGTEKDSGGSAVLRYKGREEAYNLISLKFGLHETIFGAGYLVMWIDNPIIESFVDLGIIGLLSYIGLVFFLPLRVMVKKIDNNVVILGVMLTLHAIMTSMNSGNPYMYIKYAPVCLLMLIYSTYCSKERLKNIWKKFKSGE